MAYPAAIEATLDVEGGAHELAVASSSGAEALAGPWRSPVGRLLRTVLAFVVFFLIVALLWESFKWLAGNPWRFENILGTGARRDCRCWPQ